MRLGVSSAAAPGLPLADLVSACGRRGLTELELVMDGGPGAGMDIGLAGAVEAAAGQGIGVAGILHEGDGDAGTTVRAAAGLGVPAILPVAGFAPFALRRLVRAAAAAGGRVLLMHGTDPAAVRRLRRAVDRLPPGAAALAWEIDPAATDPADVPDVLRHAGTRLAYVRFRGGGPESAAQTGLGVGALMARLALARYAGPLVLAPTDARAHGAWRTWLARAGGWGCGSRRSDPALVTLSPSSPPTITIGE